jgi:hypothetical protein
MGELQIGDLATWVSAGISLVSAAVAISAIRTASKSSGKAEAFAEQNARLLELQTQIDHQAWADEYFRDLTAWAANAALWMSRAIHFPSDPKVNSPQKAEILANLSAAIDTGRWYFPNRWTEDFGPNKQPAYRGLRQPVLDHLVDAYDAFSNATTRKSADKELIHQQRSFVSEIQKVLDPRSREKVLNGVIRDYVDVERLRAINGK